MFGFLLSFEPDTDGLLASEEEDVRANAIESPGELFREDFFSFFVLSLSGDS